jgi:hypothetical protein
MADDVDSEAEDLDNNDETAPARGDAGGAGDDDGDNGDDDEDGTDGGGAAPVAASAAAGAGPKKRKRAKSAYMWFMASKRKELAAANPEMRVGGIAKLIGAMWKELGEEEKKQFDDQAAADKKRFALEEAEVGLFPQLRGWCALLLIRWWP